MNEKYWPKADFSQFTMVSGIGHADGGELGVSLAFDAALHNARIGNYGVVPIEATLPPNVEFDPKIGLSEGSLLPTVYAAVFSSAKYQAIGAAIAVGIPRDKSKPGVILKSRFSAEPRPRYALSREDLHERLPAFKNRMKDNVARAMAARRIELEDILLTAVADCSCDLRTSLYSPEIVPVTAMIAAVCFW